MSIHRVLPSAMRTAGGGLLLAVSVWLGGCTAMTAQNPDTTLRPVNAVAVASAPRLMLKGADVTAYFTQGKYVQGSAEFHSQHQGVDFHFASAQAKALFAQDPARYLPQFGGYCADGLVYAIPWGGDADTWKLIDGKLYIFGGQGSKDAFELEEPQNVALAQQYWREEVQGTHSFYQRAKRLVWRVPHYKSGEELAKRVAAAKAKP